MTKAKVNVKARALATRSPRSKHGYDCGDKTRRRIIETGIQVFGENNFESATTRRIAGRAEVNLAALRYYFHNKEGLYRACAEHIANEVGAPLAAALQRVGVALQSSNVARGDLIELLLEILGGFVDDRPGEEASPAWMNFAHRAESDNSVAFKILYDRVAGKTVQAATCLFCRITGKSRNDIQAQLAVFSLIGSASIFRTHRIPILRSLGQHDAKGKRIAALRRILRRQLLVSIEGFAATQRFRQT
jgi:AcrR family transcriptional regulator